MFITCRCTNKSVCEIHYLGGPEEVFAAIQGYTASATVAAIGPFLRSAESRAMPEMPFSQSLSSALRYPFPQTQTRAS